MTKLIKQSFFILRVYRVKGYSKKDVDLGILVLRIGGPGLLATFNEINFLPSASVVYKALKNTINIETSLEIPLRTLIRSNMSQFFKNQSGFLSLKLDEIAINEKIRVDLTKKKSIFVGSCLNHKVESYEFNNYADLQQFKGNNIMN